MRFNKSLFLLCLVSTAINAGEAKLFGQSQVQSGPDYIELHLQVQSQCYKDPADATKETDKAAAEIVKFLQDNIGKTGEYNKVITQGGYISAFGKYSRACNDTFEKSTAIYAKISDIKNFGKLFNELQKIVNLKYKYDNYKSKDIPVTYVAVSTPKSALSFESNLKLEQKALKLAVANAEAKLKALFEDRPLKDLVIKNVSEVSPKFEQRAPGLEAAMRKIDFASMLSGDKKSSPVSAPVLFDNNKINKTIQVTFGYSDINIR